LIGIVSPFPIDINPNPGKVISPPRLWEGILIHIHGGGFVAQSSSQHQVYLRQWSKQNNIPVLMLTYTLSPEAKYPQALNDWWQSYLWILDNMHKWLGIAPKKIFVSGDSAGGNLATSLIGLAIWKNVRVPDALIMTYPIVLLSDKIFTPSRINMFDDIILTSLAKEVCQNAYWKDLIAEEHPFLSPYFFPEKLLGQFPPTRISLAGLDPLHDDGYQFGYKLCKMHKDVRVIDNKLLPHGFLNFGLAPLLGGECQKAIDQISDMIHELIQC
jgi:hormone-sensitive lipase